MEKETTDAPKTVEDGEVQFEVDAIKVQELCAQVDDGLLKLSEVDLLDVGKGLEIRLGRLAQKTKLQMLTEISNYIEKKCSESVEAAVNLLTPLLNDINERLLEYNNTKDNDETSLITEEQSNNGTKDNSDIKEKNDTKDNIDAKKKSDAEDKNDSKENSDTKKKSDKTDKSENTNKKTNYSKQSTEGTKDEKKKKSPTAKNSDSVKPSDAETVESATEEKTSEGKSVEKKEQKQNKNEKVEESSKEGKTVEKKELKKVETAKKKKFIRINPQRKMQHQKKFSKMMLRIKQRKKINDQKE